jgi:cytochrome c oxidase subunit 1
MSHQVHDQEIHHGDHSHDHKESFITKYIFSQDHKMISKQFLITGITMGVVGLLLSVLFRIQLGWPEGNLSFLKPLLGKWIEITDGKGKLDPSFYMSMVTIHGTIMVFFVLTAGLSGTFSNLLIPFQVGARDMASPFLNMLSYWFFFCSSVIMFASLFYESGPASGGWTIYPPLSALPTAMPGSGMGMTLWLVSMILFIASSLLAAINYVTTVLNMRTKGMSMTRLPLTIWAFTVTAILGILSFPVLLGGSLLLVFDRSFGTSFYLSDIWLAGTGALHHTGGSPILWQHLFWFLGHPEVYIVLLPALGITSEVIATNSRKPIFGYRAMIMSILAIGFLSFIVWGHHMFITGMNPLLGSAFMLATLIIAVPSAVKVFNYLATLWKGNIRLTPAMLFAMGLVSFFISGGLTGLYLGNTPLDINLHDTYFVVAHFHLVMGSATIFGMFCGIYHWFPRMFGRMMSPALGYLHFWITFLSAYFVFGPMHYSGLAGVPRRYYAFNVLPEFDVWVNLSVLISIAAIIGAAAQLLFLYNFFYSMFKGKRSVMNPWESNTLEWTSPVVGIHGNWHGDLPTVHRWPYDYSKPGALHDFVPQDVTEAEEMATNTGEPFPEDKEAHDLGKAKTKPYTKEEDMPNTFLFSAIKRFLGFSS